MEPQTEYFGLYVDATPPAPPLTGTEVVPVILSGITNNTTTQAIANLFAGAPAKATVQEDGLTPVSTPVVFTFPPPPFKNIVLVLATGSVVTTDTTATVTIAISWNDQTATQTQSFGPFAIATATAFSAQLPIMGDSITDLTVTFTLATPTGTANVEILALTFQPG